MMLNLKKMKYMQLTLSLALGKERWEYLLLAYDASLFSAYLHFFLNIHGSPSYWMKSRPPSTKGLLTRIIT